MATSIKLDDEMKQRVQKLAALRHRSSHWILREAIAQYVEREEARERFKQEARGKGLVEVLSRDGRASHRIGSSELAGKLGNGVRN